VGSSPQRPRASPESAKAPFSDRRVFLVKHPWRGLSTRTRLVRRHPRVRSPAEPHALRRIDHIEGHGGLYLVAVAHRERLDQNKGGGVKDSSSNRAVHAPLLGVALDDAQHVQNQADADDRERPALGDTAETAAPPLSIDSHVHHQGEGVSILRSGLRF
jgi:hypothetical protein